MKVEQLVGSNPGTFFQIWLVLRKKRRKGGDKGKGEAEAAP